MLTFFVFPTSVKIVFHIFLYYNLSIHSQILILHNDNHFKIYDKLFMVNSILLKYNLSLFDSKRA